MKRVISLIIAAALALFLVPAAHASGGYQGWGPRLGLTMDPDQFHFGAHADLSTGKRNLRLQPNLELGLGNDLTVLSLQLDGAFRLNSNWDAWSPYLGGGVGWYVIGDGDDGIANGKTTNGAGLSPLVGIERGLSSGSRYFIEAKVGFFDAPEVKLTTGWTFHP